MYAYLCMCSCTYSAKAFLCPYHWTIVPTNYRNTSNTWNKHVKSGTKNSSLFLDGVACWAAQHLLSAYIHLQTFRHSSFTVLALKHTQVQLFRHSRDSTSTVLKGKHIQVQTFRHSSSNVPTNRHIEVRTFRHNSSNVPTGRQIQLRTFRRRTFSCTKVYASDQVVTYYTYIYFGTLIYNCGYTSYIAGGFTHSSAIIPTILMQAHPGTNGNGTAILKVLKALTCSKYQ